MLLFLLLVIGGATAGCLSYQFSQKNRNVLFISALGIVFMAIGAAINIAAVLLIGLILEDRGVKLMALDKVLGQAILWPIVGAIVGIVKAGKAKEVKPDNGTFSFLASPSTIYWGLAISSVALVFFIAVSAPKEDAIAQQAERLNPAPATAKQAIGQTVSNAEADRELEEKRLLDEHYNKILASHSDVFQIIETSEYKTWLSANPQFQPIHQDGTTDQVIDMLWQYKVYLAARSTRTPAPPTAPRTQPPKEWPTPDQAKVDREMQNLSDWSNRHNYMYSQ